MTIDKDIQDLSILHKSKKFKDMHALSLSLEKKYPNNPQILNALAVSNKELGYIEEAKNIYNRILQLDAKAEYSHIFTNAGFLYFDSGEVAKSMEFHKIAIKLDSKNLNSYRGLGLAEENSGNADEAIKYYKKGLEIDKKDDLLNFSIANIYRVQNKFSDAITYYEFSDAKLSKTNQLECIYKNNDKLLFNHKLKNLINNNVVEPLVASLSAHASARFNQKDEYNFCPNPFEYVCKADLFADQRFNNQLIESFFEEINQSNITKKKQSLLQNGFQSSGNLFLHNSPSINIMKEIINDSIESFRKKFINHDIDLIKRWPKNYSILSWLIVMKKQGNLLAHMHKHGWISGSIYLRIPEKEKENEGDIKFSTHGGDYPHDNKIFPSKIVDLKKGNIVMFPSSLFHSTIPFSSNEDRITLAFDVIPE